MLWKLTQRTFNGGQLDRRLMGRSDLAKYYQGASVLKNFVVKRQGCIVRRRGTNLLTDVTSAAASAGIATVAKWRLIPFTYETDGGYALVLVAGATGTGKCLVYDKTGTLKATLSVPYTGDELAAICYEQSGDTLFLAHRSHPFARIVCAGDDSWTYETINFTTCGRDSLPAVPEILSVEKEPDEWSGEGPQKTIYYYVTAVKDGIESPPSEPVDFQYKTPWPEGGAVVVKTKPMTPAPDYCNIYKKDGNFTGFIGVMREEIEVTGSERETYYVRLDDFHDIQTAIITNVYRDCNVVNIEWLLEGDRRLQYEQIGVYASHTGVVEYIPNYRDGGVDADTINLPLGGVLRTYEDYWGFLDPNKRQYWYANYIPPACTSVRCVVTLEDGSEKDLGLKQIPDEAKVLPGADPSTYRKIFPTPETWGRDDETTLARNIKLTWNVSNRHKLKIVKVVLTAYTDAAGTTVATGSISIPPACPNRASESDSYRPSSIDEVWTTFTGSPLVYGRLEFYKNIYTATQEFIDDYITPDASLTPPKYESHFDQGGQFPGCVTLYQQRLALGSTEEQPFTFWLSCVGDLYNFNVHDTMREDDALEVTLPATKYPDINHMVLNRDLILFCDSGEWIVAPVTGNSLTHKTISTKIQSQMGSSKHIKPITINDEVLFANMTAETLIATKYSYATDGYESTDLSVLSQDLFDGNPMTSFAFCQHPDSIIYATLADGTFATLTYMKEHEVVAWSHHELGGGLKALCCCADGATTDGTTDVYILAQATGGALKLLKVKGEAPAGMAAEAVSMDMMYVVTTGGTVPQSCKAVDVLTGSVLSAGAMMTSDRRYVVGYPFASRLVTVKPEPNAHETVRFETKNPTEVEICVNEGSTFKVGQFIMDASKDKTVELAPTINTTTGAITLATSDEKALVSGYNNRDGRIRLTCDGCWPLTILSLSTTYQIEPANQEPKGSRGDEE